MKKALRLADGKMLSKGLYKAVSKSGKLIASGLWQVAKDKFPSVKKNVSQSFFESAMAVEWRNALAELEQEQPILQLCAGSWKAEQMLSNILRFMAKKEKKGRKQGNRGKRNNGAKLSDLNSDSESESDASLNPKPSLAKRKRPLTEDESECSTKKKRTSLQPEWESQTDDIDPSPDTASLNKQIDTISISDPPASKQQTAKRKGKQRAQNGEFFS